MYLYLPPPVLCSLLNCSFVSPGTIYYWFLVAEGETSHICVKTCLRSYKTSERRRGWTLSGSLLDDAASEQNLPSCLSSTCTANTSGDLRGADPPSDPLLAVQSFNNVSRRQRRQQPLVQHRIPNSSGTTGLLYLWNLDIHLPNNYLITADRICLAFRARDRGRYYFSMQIVPPLSFI